MGQHPPSSNVPHKVYVTYRLNNQSKRLTTRTGATDGVMVVQGIGWFGVYNVAR